MYKQRADCWARQTSNAAIAGHRGVSKRETAGRQPQTVDHWETHTQTRDYEICSTCIRVNQPTLALQSATPPGSWSEWGGGHSSIVDTHKPYQPLISLFSQANTAHTHTPHGLERFDQWQWPAHHSIVCISRGWNGSPTPPQALIRRLLSVCYIFFFSSSSHIMDMSLSHSPMTKSLSLWLKLGVMRPACLQRITVGSLLCLRYTLCACQTSHDGSSASITSLSDALDDEIGWDAERRQLFLQWCNTEQKPLSCTPFSMDEEWLIVWS